MNEASRKTTSNAGVIVRVGDKEWTVGQSSSLGAVEPVEKIVALSVLEENLQEATLRANHHKIIQISDRKKSRAKFPGLFMIRMFFHSCYNYVGRAVIQSLHRITDWSSIKESFQGGLIFGLALGCASLLLFHQVNDTNAKNMSFHKFVDEVSPTVLTRAIRSPGIHVYGLSAGKFKTEREAQYAQGLLAEKGIQTVIVQIQGYNLLHQIALQQDDLRADVQALGKQNVQVSVLPIAVSSQDYPALPSASVSSVTNTSTWLSSEASALIALCGWSMDGGRQADGIRAFENANHVYPTDTVLSSTGLSVPLGQLREAVDVAYSACAKGDKQQTEAAVLKGYQILLNWQGLDIQ